MEGILGGIMPMPRPAGIPRPGPGRIYFGQEKTRKNMYQNRLQEHAVYRAYRSR